jgi:hypothetical protein
MTTMSDQEFAQTEALLRQRLTQLATYAPTAVNLPDEVPVVAANRPIGRGRRVGVIAAVTALIGAGGFTTYSFLGASNDGGAATPQEAVQTFVSAMDNQDILGMIDVTLPVEVDALRAAADSISSEAKRIGVLADDFNTSGVQGLDLGVDDLVLETNYLEGGLATVTATSGMFTASFDPQAFRFGEQLRALLDAGQPVDTDVIDLALSDPRALVMTVERDGRWYVSLEYTIAEYVRRAAGWDIPGPVTRAPVGFDSAEAAVTGFYERLATLDLQSAIDTFAPGEDAMAWLAQSWIDDAQSAIDRGRADGWSVEVSGLTYETIGTADHLTLRPLTFKVEGTTPAGYNQDAFSNADPAQETVVMAFDGSGFAVVPPGQQVPATIDALTFSDVFPSDDGRYNFTNANEDGTITPLVFPTDPTGGPQPFTVERADGCSTFTGSMATSMFGSDPGPTVTPVDGGYKWCGTGNGLFGVLGVVYGGSAELLAVSVVQSGGKWYVSPLGTVLGSVTTSFHDIEDGTSLFDSPLSAFIYGGLNRTYLDSLVQGQQADAIDAACLPALTVEDGVVTGIVADPQPDAIRACADTISYSSGDSQSGSGTEPPEVVVTEAPASTVLATTVP